MTRLFSKCALLSVLMFVLVCSAPAYAWINVHSSYGMAGSVTVYEASEHIAATNSSNFKDQAISAALSMGIEYENYFNEEFGFATGINYSNRRSFTKLYQYYANLIYHVDPRFYVFAGMNFTHGSDINMTFTSGSNTAVVAIDTKPGLGYQLGLGYQVTEAINVELLYERVSLHTHANIVSSEIDGFDYRAEKFEQSSVRLGVKYSFFNLFNF